MTLIAWNETNEPVTAQALVRMDTPPPLANKVFRVTSEKLPLFVADVDCALSCYYDLEGGQEFVNHESGIGFCVPHMRHHMLITKKGLPSPAPGRLSALSYRYLVLRCDAVTGNPSCGIVG